MPILPRTTESSYLQMLKIVFRPVEYFEEYGRKYGDFWAIGSEDSPFVYVNHPDAVRTIFTAERGTFDSGRGSAEVLPFLVGRNSLILLDGQAHWEQRKLLMPPLHGEKLKTYGDRMLDITEEVTAEWKKGKSIRVRHYTQEITLRIILQVVFGLHAGEKYEEMKELLASLLESISSPLGSPLLFFSFLRKDWGHWSPWGRFLRIKRKIDALLYAEIAERRALGTDGNDIFSLLLAARDEEGNPMTDEELRDELITLLLGGHETTASSLAWALYWIHYHPEVEEKLRCELAGLGPRPDPLAIAKLPYLSAVCSETLRINPITLTSSMRISNTSLDLMGYHFQAGTAFIPCIYLVHRREEIYPEADQFKPERFLDRQYLPHEYFPFGGGDRRCIGMGLATLEMKLGIAAILDCFRLILPNPRLLKPCRRGFLLAPPENLQLKVVN